LFWAQLPWEEIKDELGDIHVVDVGCGSGQHARLLRKCSGNRVSSYLGIDIRSHDGWKARGTEGQGTEFVEGDCETFNSLVPRRTNLIVSQSTIEHVRGDLTFFDQVRGFVDGTDAPVLQIHLFPSKACLGLYLFHGIRQYTPRTIEKIVKVLGESDRAWLFELGGAACNRAHWKWIRIPESITKQGDQRRAYPDRYCYEVWDAIGRDRVAPGNTPSFYALVIDSHPRRLADAIWSTAFRV
jgi:SAM-dependent methyltransferase